MITKSICIELVACRVPIVEVSVQVLNCALCKWGLQCENTTSHVTTICTCTSSNSFDLLFCSDI